MKMRITLILSHHSRIKPHLLKCNHHHNKILHCQKYLHFKMNLNLIPKSTLHKKTSKDHADVPTIGRGNYFPTQMFDDLTPEQVQVIRKYIDGFVFYKVKTYYSNWTRKRSVLRYFNMCRSSKSGYHSYQKIVNAKVHGFARIQIVLLNQHHTFINQIT